MNDFHQLETEKYVDEAQAREATQVRSAMRHRTERQLLLFTFAAAVFILAMVFVLQMPNWMPSVNSWLEEAGILSDSSNHLFSEPPAVES